MSVAIVKFNAGNITSVKFALERLGASYTITDDPSAITSADRVILPGVGEASSAMKYLKERGLDHIIRSLQQPFLGICLGMQLLCTNSDEGNADGLNIIAGRVKKFSSKLKVPLIGWNCVKFAEDELFFGLKKREFQYFVHSYYLETGDRTIAEAQYGISYSAAVRHLNFRGVQFHPEKSAEPGLQILKNFLNMKT